MFNQQLFTRLFVAAREDPQTITIWLFVAVGIILRVGFYLLNRSFWLDEASLALNFVEQCNLLGPLHYFQAAPLGFLLLTKTITFLAGEKELAFRFLPLCASLVSLILFPKLAAKLAPPNAVPICVAIFAFSGDLLYFSQEFKPYALDVLACILLSLSTLELMDKPITPQRVVALIATAVFASFFSFASFFVSTAGIITLTLVAFAKRQWQLAAVAISFAIIVAGCFAVQYGIAIAPIKAAERAVFIGDWRNRQAFLHLLPQSFRDLEILTTAVTEPAARVLSVTGKAPLAIFLLMFIGLQSIFRLSGLRFALVVLPLVIGIIASGSEVYPWRGRFVLFVAPQSAIITGVSIYLFARTLWRQVPAFAVTFIIICLFPYYALTLNQPLTEREEFRTVTLYIKAHYRRGQDIYLYRHTRNLFRFYRRVYEAPKAHFWYGDKWPTPAYLKKKSNNKQVWVVFGHLPWGVKGPALLAALKEDFKVLDKVETTGAYAYLIDYKNPDTQSTAAPVH